MTLPATDPAPTAPGAVTDPGAIRARRVRFGWEDTPLHWVPGDPQTTHTINVLHLLLPEGEKWFAHVIRQTLDRIDDPDLLADVKGFIGQESVHSRAHAVVLDHLAAQGLPTRAFTAHVHRLFWVVLADRPFGRRLPRPLARRWLDLRLALIAAIEHFTAVLGVWILDAPGLDAADPDPEMLDLIRWHGAEEVEHRSVAFDLYQEVGGGYPTRVAAMALTAPAIFAFWWAGTRYLVSHDPTAPPEASWRTFGRAVRAGRLPRLRSIYGTVPGYLRPGHHPSHTGSTADALAYLATSPGVHAPA